MQGKVAAGILSAICEVAVAKGWASASELLDAMALDAADIAQPTPMVPIDAYSDLLVFLREHTQNPAAGLELGLGLADMFDLRKQGFWGYALLSSLTLRQRIEMHQRYQSLRSPEEMRLSESDGVARAEMIVRGVSDQALQVHYDSSAALALVRFLRFFEPRKVIVRLSFTFAEQPYHARLRSLCTGPVRFDAELNSLEFPAAELDFKFNGDPYLNQLARSELDNLAARQESAGVGALVQEVREQLERRLSYDATLERIASDLRLSARTLQRKLGELGASFQDLLEEVRKARAHTYLAETDQPVEEIAALLGYGDPANFRRAFRRWTGMAPAGFRARERGQRRAGAK
jgi:AraC-like DNA-binding protein